jgi:hypothetical protein
LLHDRDETRLKQERTGARLELLQQAGQHFKDISEFKVHVFRCTYQYRCSA